MSHRQLLLRTAAAASAALMAMAFSAAPAWARPDFTGVWKMADHDLVIRPDVGDPPYTAEAKRRLAETKAKFGGEADEPAKFCVVNGMPWTMLSRARDYSNDIKQTDDRVTVLSEYMDTIRMIHLDGSKPPETFLPSAQGYSSATWEGETLVVRTSALRPRSEVGLLQRSDQMEIVERWSLRTDAKHGEVIDIEMTITDPVIFTQPVKGHQVFSRAPKGYVINAYGCTDALWDEYVDKKKAGAGQ